MCDKCVEKGEMTPEQLEEHVKTVMKEAAELVDILHDVFEGKEEAAIINALVNVGADFVIDTGLPPELLFEGVKQAIEHKIKHRTELPQGKSKSWLN